VQDMSKTQANAVLNELSTNYWKCKF